MKEKTEDSTWREIVLNRLNSIDERLSAIESNFNEATSFADGILAGDSVFDAESLSGLKDMFSSVLPMTGSMGDEAAPVDLESLIGSLKDLKSELTGLNTSITNTEDTE